MSATNKHPILLVDDEPEMLYSLTGLLRREFELYTAESGRAALEILQQHAIHVVMTDQRMPEMTGMQLLRRVQDVYPDAIRIVFTGYADIKAVIDGINRVGLYRYITKPWDPDELIEVLHQAAARYDELVERTRLLADLRDYVTRGQALLQGLREQLAAAGAAPVGFEELAQAGDQLLQRLDRVTPTGR
jgi:DNA-binding NtrC family response regulator